jgi:hypothetical protein
MKKNCASSWLFIKIICGQVGVKTDWAAWYGVTWHDITQKFAVFIEINIWFTFGSLLILLFLRFNSFSKLFAPQYVQFDEIFSHFRTEQHACL